MKDYELSRLCFLSGGCTSAHPGGATICFHFVPSLADVSTSQGERNLKCLILRFGDEALHKRATVMCCMTSIIRKHQVKPLLRTHFRVAVL